MADLDLRYNLKNILRERGMSQLDLAKNLASVLPKDIAYVKVNQKGACPSFLLTPKLIAKGKGSLLFFW